MITAIWDKAERVDITPYRDAPYGAPMQRLRDYMRLLGRNGPAPERLGEIIAHALTTPRPNTRCTVSPQPQKDFLGRILPKRWVDRLIGRRLGLLPVLR